MDYVIKDKTFLESIMDTEFYDTQETGIFYNGKKNPFWKLYVLKHVLFEKNDVRKSGKHISRWFCCHELLK